MKMGDHVLAVWKDGEETVGTYAGEERGYILIKVKETFIPCLRSHLESLEVIDENR